MAKKLFPTLLVALFSFAALAQAQSCVPLGGSCGWGRGACCPKLSCSPENSGFYPYTAKDYICNEY